MNTVANLTVDELKDLISEVMEESQSPTIHTVLDDRKHVGVFVDDAISCLTEEVSKSLVIDQIVDIIKTGVYFSFFWIVAHIQVVSVTLAVGILVIYFLFLEIGRLSKLWKQHSHTL